MPAKRANKSLFHGISILILLFIVQCQPGGRNGDHPVPANLIPADTMITILVDVHLIESSLKMIHTKKLDNERYTDSYYHTLFEKHHITRQQFLQSLEYYEQDAKMLEKIYEDVIIELSKMESQAR
ncbi:MAG: DUF4296 domain-containing protein [Bacteroidales bacterium]|nr:DUF4296 domain-containing protein [Bacteroidales bacterium]